jgi:hypothetical protein
MKKLSTLLSSSQNPLENELQILLDLNSSTKSTCTKDTVCADRIFLCLTLILTASSHNQTRRFGLKRAIATPPHARHGGGSGGEGCFLCTASEICLIKTWITLIWSSKAHWKWALASKTLQTIMFPEILWFKIKIVCKAIQDLFPL